MQHYIYYLVPVSNRPSGVARPVQKVFPQRRLTSTVSCDNINKQVSMKLIAQQRNIFVDFNLIII